MNENAIVLYNSSSMEIWIKNIKNIFIKNKIISTKASTNILINSKCNLLLYGYYDGILAWYIKENIPQNIITSVKLRNNITYIFFINHEDLLGAHIYKHYFSYIYFFKMKDFSIVKKMNITKKAGKDFILNYNERINIYKINENKIICLYPKDKINKTNYVIIKIPEFTIEKINRENSIFNFFTFKNYFFFYSWGRKIKIFESNKYKLVQEIDVKGFCSMIHLKENYFLGLKTEYAIKNCEVKTLIMFQLNL